jgi:adenylate cyclase class IV
VPRGRLKLREIEGRPASQVCLASVEDGTVIRTLLIAALDVRARVVKRHEVWRCEGVQVHLDTVERLGTFVEFEEPVRTGA